MNTKTILYILSLLSFCACCKNYDTNTVASPDGKVELSLINNEGQLHYALTWNGQEMITNSELSILPNATIKVMGTSIASKDSSWKTVW